MTTDDRAKQFTERLIFNMRLHPEFNRWWCEQYDALQADLLETIETESEAEFSCGTMDGTPEAIAALSEKVERDMLGLRQQIQDLKRYDGSEQTE